MELCRSVAYESREKTDEHLKDSRLKFAGMNRVGLSLTLGVLVGLTLILLPGILASPTSAAGPSSNSTGTTSSYNPSIFTVRAGPSGIGSSTGGSSIVTSGSLFVLILLVLIPAVALSFFARTWTLRQNRLRLQKNWENDISTA